MALPITHQEWSTSGLIGSINRNALLAAAQGTFQQADFIQMMNEVQQSTVVPFIVGLDANYFMKTAMISVIPSNSVALTAGASSGSMGPNVAYSLPADAIGKKLKDVAVVDPSGCMYNLTATTPWRAGSPGAQRFGHLIQGDVIFLFPAQAFSSYSSLQLIYPAAPQALCDDTGTYGVSTPSSAQIASVAVSGGTAVITCTSALPPSLQGAGVPINFIGGNPQFTTNLVTTTVSASGTTITIPAALISDTYGRQIVNVGDWVANAGYAPFCQLPAEGRNLVTQAAIVKLYKALGDREGAAAAQEDYNAMQKAAELIFSPRVDDSPKILTTAGRGIGAYRYLGPWTTY